MEFAYDQMALLGLSILLDLTVTVWVVRILCNNKLICRFNKPSLLLFNLLILIFCTILMRLDISMGMGVGLFAVLAMFRFRSEILRTQEMFYLLMLIAIGFVHAAFPGVLSLLEVLIIDVIFILISYFLTYKNEESGPEFKVTLKNLSLVKLQNRSMLEDHLKDQLGYEINNVSIKNIDFKKGCAYLVVSTKPIVTIKEEKPVAQLNPAAIFEFKAVNGIGLSAQAG